TSTMAAEVPALPLELDPLIAEAKQRARRRRFALALLLLAGATGTGFYLSRPSGSGGGGRAGALSSGISVPPVVGRGFIQSPPASALAAQMLVAMSFPTVRVGYLVTGDGRLLRSSDGGRTWRQVGSLGRI